MNKICQQCGQEYQTANKNQKRCSSRCLAAAMQKEKTEIKCKVCNKIRYVSPSLAGKAKYCSQHCYRKGRNPVSTINGKKFRKCTKCGELLIWYKFPLRASRQEAGCQQCCNNARKLWHRTPHGRFVAAVAAAKRKRISWALEEDQYIELSFKPCVYCGDSTGEAGIGLDRKNSQLGYALENVVPCCKGCNMVRGKDYIPFDIMVNEIAPIIRRIKEQSE